MNTNAITPAIIEEGAESAKGFLSKLIIPAIEEVGLLIRDPVMMWKFRNEVNMLNKAKAICEKNNINPKAISLKLLVRLLSNAALEEDNEMQDKWAILLSNLADSEQNIENHVFPYILSQLSKNEFIVLESTYDAKQNRIQQLENELDVFRMERPKKESELLKRIDEIDLKVKMENKDDVMFRKYLKLSSEKNDLTNELVGNKYYEERNLNKRKQPESIPYKVLKDFEESNLIRLGLAKEVREIYADSQTLEIPVATERSQQTGYVNLDLEVDVNSVEDVILTELGELFISACKEKRIKK